MASFWGYAVITATMRSNRAKKQSHNKPSIEPDYGGKKSLISGGKTKVIASKKQPRLPRADTALV